MDKSPAPTRTLSPAARQRVIEAFARALIADLRLDIAGDSRAQRCAGQHDAYELPSPDEGDRTEREQRDEPRGKRRRRRPAAA